MAENYVPPPIARSRGQKGRNDQRLEWEPVYLNMRKRRSGRIGVSSIFINRLSPIFLASPRVSIDSRDRSRKFCERPSAIITSRQRFNARLSRRYLRVPCVSLFSAGIVAASPIVLTFAIRFHFLQTAPSRRPPRPSIAVSRSYPCVRARRNYKFPLRHDRNV